MKYRVVQITNNIVAYPEYKRDTVEFSHLVEAVEDEVALFIINENGDYYPAAEFFYMVEISWFQTE